MLQIFQHYEPSYKWKLVLQDPDDDKFTDCAVGSKADYLVSDDKHILSLRQQSALFPPLTIITFNEFEDILRGLSLQVKS